MAIVTISPFFGIIIGFISSILLVLGSVWFERANKPEERFNCPLATGIRALIFSALTYFALIMFDIIIKVGFLGVLGYAHLQYHLMTLILLGILGSVIIIGTVFTAPTIKTFIAFVIDLGIYVYYLWFNYLDGFSAGEFSFIYIPLPLFLVVPLIIELIWILIQAIRKKPIFEKKLLWDNTRKFKKYINFRFYVVMWLLISIEFILGFEGLSIICWT